MSDIFLGQPPAAIKKFIIEHYGSKEDPDPVDNTAFGQLVLALEGSNGGTVAYRGNTLETGGAISDIAYQVNDNDSNSVVNSTWINLGYNGSIPEYVKYRRAVGDGWKRVWVPSMKSGALAQIAVGDQCYTRTFDDTTLEHTYTASEGETVTAIGTETFTYGNNNTYSVPKTITTSKGTYEFCGYNITLNQRDIMLDTTPNANTVYTYVYFDKDSNSNRWSAATKLRSFLNDKTGTADGYYADADWENCGDYTINSLVSKVASEDGFLKNITKTVNRTWVSGGSEDTTADRFWLLGNGNINHTESWLKDGDKDTSKFSTVFADTTSARIKSMMTASGGSGDAVDWWLRSADSDRSSVVGYVGGDGYVYDVDANYSFGVAAACLIG